MIRTSKYILNFHHITGCLPQNLYLKQKTTKNKIGSQEHLTQKWRLNEKQGEDRKTETEGIKHKKTITMNRNYMAKLKSENKTQRN